MALMVLAVSGYVYLKFQEPSVMDIANYHTEDKVTVDELISMFIKDKRLANSAYVEKTIEVKGIIKEINYLNKRQTILLSSQQFAESFVICDMLPTKNKKMESLAIGDSIVVKGICKGFLSDVVMLNCISIDTTSE